MDDLRRGEVWLAARLMSVSAIAWPIGGALVVLVLLGLDIGLGFLEQTFFIVWLPSWIVSAFVLLFGAAIGAVIGEVLGLVIGLLTVGVAYVSRRLKPHLRALTIAFVALAAAAAVSVAADLVWPTDVLFTVVIDSIEVIGSIAVFVVYLLVGWSGLITTGLTKVGRTFRAKVGIQGSRTIG